MGTLQNTFAARLKPAGGFLLRAIGIVALLFCVFAAITSPIPFGARLIRGGRMESPNGPQEFAVYELDGKDALTRIRATAESRGYVVQSADSRLIVLAKDNSRILAKRGRALQSLLTSSGEVATDETDASASILVWSRVPEWRAAIRCY